MLFIVRFTDKPGTLPLRTELLQRHLDWLATRTETVLAAGSLKVDPASAPVGACWIVKAESKSGAELIFQTDPFWTHGIRQDFEILHWNLAFPDRTISL